MVILAVHCASIIPATSDVDTLLPSWLLLLFSAHSRAVLKLTLAQLFGKEKR